MKKLQKRSEKSEIHLQRIGPVNAMSNFDFWHSKSYTLNKARVQKTGAHDFCVQSVTFREIRVFHTFAKNRSKIVDFEEIEKRSKLSTKTKINIRRHTEHKYNNKRTKKKF